LKLEWGGKKTDQVVCRTVRQTISANRRKDCWNTIVAAWYGRGSVGAARGNVLQKEQRRDDEVFGGKKARASHRAAGRRKKGRTCPSELPPKGKAKRKKQRKSRKGGGLLRARVVSSSGNRSDISPHVEKKITKAADLVSKHNFPLRRNKKKREKGCDLLTGKGWEKSMIGGKKISRRDNGVSRTSRLRTCRSSWR